MIAESSKYAEIIARRKAGRANDDTAEDEYPLRFKAVRTVDGGIALIRKK